MARMTQKTEYKLVLGDGGKANKILTAEWM
jgi:hypothetical protein